MILQRSDCLCFLFVILILCINNQIISRHIGPTFDNFSSLSLSFRNVYFYIETLHFKRHLYNKIKNKYVHMYVWVHKTKDLTISRFKTSLSSWKRTCHVIYRCYNIDAASKHKSLFIICTFNFPITMLNKNKIIIRPPRLHWLVKFRRNTFRRPNAHISDKYLQNLKTSMRKNYLKQTCCFFTETEADGLKYPMFV